MKKLKKLFSEKYHLLKFDLKMKLTTVLCVLSLVNVYANSLDTALTSSSTEDETKHMFIFFPGSFKNIAKKVIYIGFDLTEGHKVLLAC